MVSSICKSNGDADAKECLQTDDVSNGSADVSNGIPRW
jgi:hypothetical protein